MKEDEKKPPIEWAAIITVIVILATYFFGLAVVIWLFDGIIVAIYGSVLVVALLMTLSIFVVMTWMIVYNFYLILSPFVSKTFQKSETLQENQ